jgi:hypothetical protein
MKRKRKEKKDNKGRCQMKTEKKLTIREQYVAHRIGLLRYETWKRHSLLPELVQVYRQANQVRKLLAYRRTHANYERVKAFVLRLKAISVSSLAEVIASDKSPTVELCMFIKKNNSLWYTMSGESLVKYVEAELEIEGKTDVEIENMLFAMRL